MQSMPRQQAVQLLKEYNKEPFHLLHALTVEGVMRYYARELGYSEQEDFWGIAGLLHDIDFELYPSEHCLKAPKMLREAGVSVSENRFKHAENRQCLYCCLKNRDVLE